MLLFVPNQTAYLYFQVVVDTGLNNELFVNLSAPLSNISFRVCAYTTVGQGPWTPLQTITLIPAGEPTEYSWLLTVNTSKLLKHPNIVFPVVVFSRNATSLNRWVS